MIPSPPTRLPPEDSPDKYNLSRVRKARVYANQASTWNRRYRRFSPMTTVAYLQLGDECDRYLELSTEGEKSDNVRPVQELIRFFETQLFNHKQFAFPSSPTATKLLCDISECNRHVIFARYGDYAEKWWKDLKATAKKMQASGQMKEGPTIFDGQWVTSARAEILQSKEHWQVLQENIKESKEHWLKGDSGLAGPYSMMVEVANFVNMSLDDVEQLIYFYADRNDTFHNNLKCLIRDNILGDVAELLYKDYQWILKCWPAEETQYKTMLMAGIERQVKLWFNTTPDTNYKQWHATQTQAWKDDVQLENYKQDLRQSSKNKQIEVKKRESEQAIQRQKLLEDLFKNQSEFNMLRILFATETDQLPAFETLSANERQVVQDKLSTEKRRKEHEAAKRKKTRDAAEGKEKQTAIGSGSAQRSSTEGLTSLQATKLRKDKFEEVVKMSNAANNDLKRVIKTAVQRCFNTYSAWLEYQQMS